MYIYIYTETKHISFYHLLYTQFDAIMAPSISKTLILGPPADPRWFHPLASSVAPQPRWSGGSCFHWAHLVYGEYPQGLVGKSMG